MADDELRLPKRYYVVGDEVVLRIELTHVQNLDEIRVAYGKDGGRDNTITFIGEVEDTVDAGQVKVPVPPPEYAHLRSPYPLKRSTAVLTTIVDIDHRPGHYELIYILCRTASGAPIGVNADDLDESTKSASFRVLPEPIPPEPPLFDPQVSIDLLDEVELQDENDF